MEEKRVSLAEQIRIALSKPLWYKALIEQPVRQHVLYFVLLIILVTAIRCIVPTSAYIKSAGGIHEMVYNGMPEFTLEDGILNVSSKVDVEIAGIRVIIDTSRTEFSEADAENVASMMKDSLPIVYLISKTNIASNTVDIPMSLSNLSITLNNDVLYDNAYYIIGAWVVFFVLETVIGYVISALFFALFGFLLGKALGLKVQYKQVVLIALYAKSLEIILEAILEAVGISLLYYIGTIIGIFITCSYMTRGMTSLAIRSTNSDQDDSTNRFIDFRG